MVSADFWLSWGWWLSGSHTVVARVGGGVVKVMERFGRGGMGYGMECGLWVVLDRDDAKVFVVDRRVCGVCDGELRIV